MTELLYLKDSYLKEFEAKVVLVQDNKIALDKTAFYPAGGGQPTDIGKIFLNEKEFEVVEVKKENGEIWHKLKEANGIEAGLHVKGIVDWDYRYNIMRMHTSAHVLAAVIFNSTKKLITGNQIGWPLSRMDFNAIESFDSGSVKEL